MLSNLIFVKKGQKCPFAVLRCEKSYCETASFNFFVKKIKKVNY